MAAGNETTDHAVQLPALSPQRRTLVTQAMEDVFSIDQEDALPFIESRLQQLDPQEVGEALECLQAALQSSWQLFSALKFIQKDADFHKAYPLFLAAKDRFSSIGYSELADLSFGLGTYAKAVIEVQAYNIGAALGLLDEVKTYLEKAGEFGNRFVSLIDHMEPDALYIAGVRELLRSDYGSGKALIEKASAAAIYLAHNYYKKESAGYYTFRGMAQLYKATYTYFIVRADFFKLDYDRLAVKKDAADDATQARELLSKGFPENELVKDATFLASAFEEITVVTIELAELMHNIFRSTFKPDHSVLFAIQHRINRASDWAAKAGPQAAGLVTMCTALSDSVRNIERLARPSSKDFGKLSGLVACALFLPIFLVVAHANYLFGMGLGAATLITYCVIVALIGGFGFGALKFKSMILPNPAK